MVPLLRCFGKLNFTYFGKLRLPSYIIYGGRSRRGRPHLLRHPLLWPLGVVDKRAVVDEGDLVYFRTLVYYGTPK